MCGIAGVLTTAGPPAERATLQAMADALRHRGPDADGFYCNGAVGASIGFAHRRLSVIDLSHAADHPIADETGRIQVMLNGEIYNFAALRRKLEDRHAFKSHGDTEVVAHLYEEHAEKAVERLDGMFALAVWDGPRRRLLLARDRFGKKPLYYFWDGRRFAFGSEIKALLASGVPAEMDEAAVDDYLTYGYVPTPRTFFRHIRKLPPATWLVVDEQGPHRPREYWDIPYPPAGQHRAIGLGEAAEVVREMVQEAVRKRLVADVPLGLLLSGGVDSAAVAAFMARLAPGKVRTFTVGFEGDPYYDERPVAERMARHLGTEHHASVVKPRAAELVETLLAHHDEPFGDSSALPTYLVAREARRHVTVVLNGDGGDEVFAGYERFRAMLLAAAIPRPLRQAGAVLAHAIPNDAGLFSLRRRARRFALKAPLPLPEHLVAWVSFFDIPELRRLLRPGLLDEEEILRPTRDALARMEGRSLLSKILYVNARTYLLDDLLPKMDRMTMAHGLEARSPMLDTALAEYVAALPDAHKRDLRRSKIVLRKAIEPLVPREILELPKRGFAVPLGDWFRGELRPMVGDLLGEGARVGRFLEMRRVAELVAEHDERKADHGHQLWTLLTLELWLRKHRFA